MDEATKDVLQTAITVVGTLGGIWLGTWLEGRRRFDDQRRQVYARFATVTRRVIAALEKASDQPDPAGTPAPEDLAIEVWDTLGMIQIVGGENALDAAEVVQLAIGEWVRMPSKTADPEGWRTARARVDRALELFLKAARQDLGLRP